jgi:putative DNA primase/helicase
MSELADRCRNQWSGILPALGIDRRYLTKKGGPCPMCGGRDRFSFTDKGWGRWYCRGCGDGHGGPGGGDGVRLVERALGVDFHEAAKRIDELIGGRSAAAATITPQVIDFPRKAEKPTGDIDKPLRPWCEAAPSIRSTAAERYLAGRGLVLTASEAAPLRLHPRLKHWPSGMWWPTLVALVAMHDGTELCAHLTFLAKNGHGKAPVEKPKLFPAGAHPVGGGVWFGKADQEHEFIVAEGIESTLSAMRLCGAASGCAALSAAGISKLVLPPEARRVRIYADNDADRKGVLAACEARRRWESEGRTVAIKVAREAGKDANDIWQRRLAHG